MDDCIFKVNNSKCFALTKKDCKECTFYKSKKEYKTKYYRDGQGKKQRGVERV